MTILSLEWLLPSPPLQPPAKTTVFSMSIRQMLPAAFPFPRRFVVVCSVKPAISSILEEPGDIRIVQFRAEPNGQRPMLVSDVESADGSVRELSERPLTDALVFEYYQKARMSEKFCPDRRTLRILIRYLTKSKDWNSILMLAEDFKSFGVFPEKPVYASLISSCIQARKFQIVDTLLGVLEASHGALVVAAFDAALRGYNKLHMYTSTVRLYDQMVNQMVKRGISLDAGCYCSVMDAHRKLSNTPRVLDLFHEFESAKLNCSPTLLSQIYLILCDSFGRSGRAIEALKFFRQMEERGVVPGSQFYVSLIGCFAGGKEAEIAWDLFLEAKEKGLVKDPSIFQKLVLMYVDVGLPGKTLEVVKEMKDMGFLVSDCVLCAVVNGHSKNGGLRAAVRAFEEVIELGCIPGQVTYASMINVFCRLGLHAKAQAVFDKMIQRGFHKCVVAYANMVSMYGKSNRTHDAMRLLAKMKERGCEPNVWVYNSLMDMHGRAANLRQVEKLWKEMRRKNVKPDKISYTSLIAAYSKARKLEECIQYYKEFRLNGGKLDRPIAALMVGVFSKTSIVDELIKLLQDCKSYGIQLDERLYMSSLNALRDTGLQAQVKWFKESFAYAKVKPVSPEEGQSVPSKVLEDLELA